MGKHYPDDEAIARLAHGVMDLSLPAAAWTHAAHFATVLWVLRHRPEPPAEAQMPPMIRAYNEACGNMNTDTTGFHATITRASVEVARHFLSQHPSEPLHEVVDRLMGTPLGRSDWILAHWSQGRLFTVEARRAWVGPDLMALPS